MQFSPVTLTLFAVALLILFLSAIIAYLYIRFTQERRERKHDYDRLKREYDESLSFTIHEIRSPLTAIRGYASLLRDGSYGDLDDELMRAIDIIERSGEQIHILVEEYREANNIEEGRQRLHPEPTEIAHIVQEAYEEIQPYAADKDIDIHSTMKNTRTAYIDRARFRQVLHNVLNNAIEHTPEGGTIRISTESSGNTIAINISDAGPGMPDNDIERIFDKYKRGSRADSRGSGIGLYIARLLTEAHGGTIRAANNPDAGAVFRIEVPTMQS